MKFTTDLGSVIKDNEDRDDGPVKITDTISGEDTKADHSLLGLVKLADPDMTVQSGLPQDSKMTNGLTKVCISGKDLTNGREPVESTYSSDSEDDNEVLDSKQTEERSVDTDKLVSNLEKCHIADPLTGGEADLHNNNTDVIEKLSNLRLAEESDDNSGCFHIHPEKILSEEELQRQEEEKNEEHGIISRGPLGGIPTNYHPHNQEYNYIAAKNFPAMHAGLGLQYAVDGAYHHYGMQTNQMYDGNRMSSGEVRAKGKRGLPDEEGQPLKYRQPTPICNDLGKAQPCQEEKVLNFKRCFSGGKVSVCKENRTMPGDESSGSVWRQDSLDFQDILFTLNDSCQPLQAGGLCLEDMLLNCHNTVLEPSTTDSSDMGYGSDSQGSPLGTFSPPPSNMSSDSGYSQSQSPLDGETLMLGVSMSARDGYTISVSDIHRAGASPAHSSMGASPSHPYMDSSPAPSTMSASSHSQMVGSPATPYSLSSSPPAQSMGSPAAVTPSPHAQKDGNAVNAPHMSGSSQPCPSMGYGSTAYPVDMNSAAYYNSAAYGLHKSQNFGDPLNAHFNPAYSLAGSMSGVGSSMSSYTSSISFQTAGLQPAVPAYNGVGQLPASIPTFQPNTIPSVVKSLLLAPDSGVADLPQKSVDPEIVSDYLSKHLQEFQDVLDVVISDLQNSQQEKPPMAVHVSPSQSPKPLPAKAHSPGPSTTAAVSSVPIPVTTTQSIVVLPPQPAQGVSATGIPLTTSTPIFVVPGPSLPASAIVIVPPPLQPAKKSSFRPILPKNPASTPSKTQQAPETKPSTGKTKPLPSVAVDNSGSMKDQGPTAKIPATVVAADSPPEPCVKQQLQQQQEQQRQTQLHLLNIARRLVAGMLVSDLEYQDSDGDTYLHVAVCKADLNMVQSLLERLEREHLCNMIHVQNNMRQTPLYLAVSANQPRMVLLLIDYGADVNTFAECILADKRTKENKGAIHIASSNGEEYLGTLQALLKAKDLNLNLNNSYGQTALHCAILHHNKASASQQGRRINSIPIIKALVSAGADLNAQDMKNGKTPMMYALETRDIELIGALANLVEPAKMPKLMRTQAFDNSTCLKIAESMRSEFPPNDWQKLWTLLRQ